MNRTDTRFPSRSLLAGSALAAVLAQASVAAAAVDLSCGYGDITLHAELESGGPYEQLLLEEIEAGKSYFVKCSYSVTFPAEHKTFELPPWKIKVQVDGAALKVADGPQQPDFGSPANGKWTGAITAAWTSKAAGSHGILCSLDTDNTVSESNESNNICTLGLGPPRTGRLPRSGELEMEAKPPGSGVIAPQRPPLNSVKPTPDPGPVTARPLPGESRELNPQPEPPSSEGPARVQSVASAPVSQTVRLPKPELLPVRPIGSLPSTDVDATLVTTSLEIHPDQPTAGQKIEVVAKVENKGGPASKDGLGFLVLCSEKPAGPKCPKPSFAVTMPSIPYGKTHQVVVPLDAAWPTGKYRLHAGTDVIGKKDEHELELVVSPSPYTRVPMEKGATR